MLFNNSDWKLKVTDIDLYTDTVKLDGQSYPLSFAIKTLIPGYFSGLAATSGTVQDILEQLAVVGVNLENFFGPELLSARRGRQLRMQAEAERLARDAEQQELRLREALMSDAEWKAEKDRKEALRAERIRQGESVRSATASVGRSRAAALTEGLNFADKL